jgi:hypothetical protein
MKKIFIVLLCLAALLVVGCGEGDAEISIEDANTILEGADIPMEVSDEPAEFEEADREYDDMHCVMSKPDGTTVDMYFVDDKFKQTLGGMTVIDDGEYLYSWEGSRGMKMASSGAEGTAAGGLTGLKWVI